MTTLVRYRPDNFSIRPAGLEDVPVILGFIQALAEYENRRDSCVVDGPLLEQWLFRDRRAEVILGVADGDPVAFAVYFSIFSTFLGTPGLYIEDLFVVPKARDNGFGRRLLRHLAALALHRGCHHMEWSCLNWNKPAIALYQTLGATPLDDRTQYRLSGEPLAKLAGAAELS
ncbi:MAG: GNAT family N-acetyltransferase [Planctomycetes bacterium]|nr:GNAT family N-acetyltransferase [Planctomycetota bacterium]